MNYKSKYIKEKFEEDSDPIKDLDIGLEKILAEKIKKFITKIRTHVDSNGRQWYFSIRQADLLRIGLFIDTGYWPYYGTTQIYDNYLKECGLDEYFEIPGNIKEHSRKMRYILWMPKTTFLHTYKIIYDNIRYRIKNFLIEEMKSKKLLNELMGAGASPGMGNVAPASAAATTGAQMTSPLSTGSGDKFGSSVGKKLYTQSKTKKKKLMKKKYVKTPVSEAAPRDFYKMNFGSKKHKHYFRSIDPNCGCVKCGKTREQIKQDKEVNETNINPYDKIGMAMAKKMGVKPPFKKKKDKNNQNAIVQRNYEHEILTFDEYLNESTVETSNKKGFHTNIEQDTINNDNFRKVIYTGEKLQLVLMTLKPGEDIGEEIHNDTDQFFRFDAGNGTCIINGYEYDVKDGDCVIIPAGSKHNIINSGTKALQMYTIYAPPHHQDDIIQKTKKEAETQKQEFNGKTTE